MLKEILKKKHFRTVVIVLVLAILAILMIVIRISNDGDRAEETISNLKVLEDYQEAEIEAQNNLKQLLQEDTSEFEDDFLELQYRLIGDAAVAATEYELAIEYYEMAIGLSPNAASIYESIAGVEMIRGNLEATLQAYDSALAEVKQSVTAEEFAAYQTYYEALKNSANSMLVDAGLEDDYEPVDPSTIEDLDFQDGPVEFQDENGETIYVQ